MLLYDECYCDDNNHNEVDVVQGLLICGLSVTGHDGGITDGDTYGNYGNDMNSILADIIGNINNGTYIDVSGSTTTVNNADISQIDVLNTMTLCKDNTIELLDVDVQDTLIGGDLFDLRDVFSSSNVNSQRNNMFDFVTSSGIITALIVMETQVAMSLIMVDNNKDNNINLIYLSDNH